MRRCKTILYHCFAISCMLLLCMQHTQAQVPVRSCNIKDGKMFIALSKNIPASSLDSFIRKYELADLDLQHFIKTSSPDSLHKLGWKVDIDNKELVVISKPLFSVDNISDPADKIIFTQKTSDAGTAPANQVHFGANKFKSGQAFAVMDSVVIFFLRGQTNANRVRLAGSFTNWQSGALPMTKTDSGWVVRVKLPAGKHLYKFIVDNDWRTDKDNALTENDGMGNDNSVYFKTNYTFTLNGYVTAKKVYLAGSFNN